MKHLIPLLISVAVLLSGCASTIPAGTKPRFATPNPQKATVYVIDDLGGISLGTGEIIVVNGVTVGPLARRQYTWFHVPAGEMDISMNDPTIRSRKMSARRISVEAGKTYYVRYIMAQQQSDGALLGEIFSGASNGAINFRPEDLQLIPESEARFIMQGHTLVGSKSP